MSTVARRETIERWLDERVPPPPRALRERVAQALQDEPDGADLATTALHAGEGLLRRLVDGECSSREVASDLLAADALVTYAFEADAEAGARPDAIDARAAAAMRRIARLAAE